VPQVPQNRRRTEAPLAAVETCSRIAAPRNHKRSLGTINEAANALPLARWQSRQWQIN
jgi:hypothetical protein